MHPCLYTIQKSQLIIKSENVNVIFGVVEMYEEEIKSLNNYKIRIDNLRSYL
jgi:hypothetical protein